MSSETSLHILIVDDEDIIHRTLGMFLEELGHTIDGAWNGISALEAIEANNYDLALVDLRMPGMDGLVLLERVREVRPNLPTVVMTGHGDPAMAERAAELGALAQPGEAFRAGRSQSALRRGDLGAAILAFLGLSL